MQQVQEGGGGSTHDDRQKSQHQWTPAGMASPELLTLSGGVNPKPYVLPPQRTANPNLKAYAWKHIETSLFLLWALHHSKTKNLKFLGSETKLKLDHQSRSSFVENLTLEILQFYVSHFNPTVVQQETPKTPQQ